MYLLFLIKLRDLIHRYVFCSFLIPNTIIPQLDILFLSIVIIIINTLLKILIYPISCFININKHMKSFVWLNIPLHNIRNIRQ